MKTRQNYKKNTVTFSDISNESQLEMVLGAITIPARDLGCKVETLDHSTRILVSGTPEQMNQFCKAFNSRL